VFAALFLLMVLELVRRRRLKEQYSLLWLFTSFIILVLAVWRDLLEFLARLLRIAYAPSLLFIAGIAFSFALILHYSVIISRLSSQNTRLALEVGILHKELNEIRKKMAGGSEH
jgi:hypothetical protein